MHKVQQELKVLKGLQELQMSHLVQQDLKVLKVILDLQVQLELLQGLKVPQVLRVLVQEDRQVLRVLWVSKDQQELKGLRVLRVPQV